MNATEGTNGEGRGKTTHTTQPQSQGTLSGSAQALPLAKEPGQAAVLNVTTGAPNTSVVIQQALQNGLPHEHMSK